MSLTGLLLLAGCRMNNPAFGQDGESGEGESSAESQASDTEVNEVGTGTAEGGDGDSQAEAGDGASLPGVYTLVLREVSGDEVYRGLVPLATAGAVIERTVRLDPGR